nr:uncharacterized protein LOC129279952 [Lytechinus pictus]
MERPSMDEMQPLPAKVKDDGPDEPSPSSETRPSRPCDLSNTSPQSSNKSSPTNENKPQDSSPTHSSPCGNVSLDAYAKSQKVQGSPQSQKTGPDKDESKPRRWRWCNPVHICLVLGMAVATGSVAMTVCGYMSYQIALRTVIVGNETITTIDNELQKDIDKFRTFGPVLIGLGSFISMCACVLMCEARDDKKREARKQLADDEEDEDYMTRQEHMYALQREVMECEARHKSCPLYREALVSQHARHLEEVAYADESSHSSPVVLVHGPSLAEEKRRNDSQESNESEAAKVTLLREPPKIETTDVTSIPTCSNYLGPETEVETSFTASPRTTRKGIISASPPIHPKHAKPERPSNLPPIKSRSVNGPITFHGVPPAPGVCLCGEEPTRTPSKGGKTKRAKRGTERKKDKTIENKTTGSDSGSIKSVPKSSKSVASQNTDLVTHVNPLHDIPLDSFPSSQKSPHRTQTMDKHRPKSTGIVLSSNRSGATASLVPVETPLENRLTSSKASKTQVHKNPGSDPEDVWVKQQTRDLPNNNNDMSGSDKITSQTDVGGAISNPVPDTMININDRACDSNSNVPSMSSIQLSPKATPSNAVYDVIHAKSPHAHSSKSEVVL